jgi:hypothetical protein
LNADQNARTLIDPGVGGGLADLSHTSSRRLIMNRSIVSGLVAGLVAVAALGAPAQAGYHYKKHHHHVKHHFRGYHHHFVKYAPVCVKYDWVWSYGHKKWACVFWK